QPEATQEAPMNSTHAFPRRWMGFGIVVGVVLIPAIVPGEAPGGEKPKTDARRAAELVDAIVNRNQAPKIVEWKKGITERVAVFPEDYDWKEDERARTAIGQLKKDQTEAVWEELVKRIGDRHFSETVTSVKTGDAYISTVGGICAELAYARLIGV